MADDDLGWVNTIQEPLAREAMHILHELIGQFDLGRSGMLRVSGYAHDMPQFSAIGRDDHWIRKRTQVAEMLVGRGVLAAAKSQYVGGYAGAGDEIGDFLFVLANEPTVRRVHAALEGRFKPKPRVQSKPPEWERLPKNMRDALPTPPGKSEAEIAQRVIEAAQGSKEGGQSFRSSFGSTMGKLLAYLMIIMGSVLLVFLLTRFVPGFGTWLIGLLEAVSKKQA